MKPYKHIQRAKTVLNEMRYELPYSKNIKKDAERLNVLIDCINEFNDVLSNRLYTDAIDTLLYALMYEWLLQFVSKTETEKYYTHIDIEGNKTIKENYDFGKLKKLPIYYMIKSIDSDIQNGAELKKLQLIDILNHYEISQKIDDCTIFDGKFTDFDIVLKEILNTLKTTIRWTYKK